MSEVVWSKKDDKNYTDFINRLEYFNQRLDALDVNYANHIYEVKGNLKNVNGQLFYELKSTTNKKIVYYLDEENSSNLLYSDYKNPIKIDMYI